MGGIRIVTDSTAYLPRATLERYGITVVPLTVSFDGQVYREGVDLKLDEFYRRLREARTLPTTSQPAAGDFVTVYRSLAEGGDAIVSIHISEGLSGTCASARTAASMVPGARVEVIDSRITCMGLGYAVLEAARAVETGADLGEVLRRTRAVVDSSRAYFVVGDLKYLHKGGRIGGAQALVGSMLQVKPILFMNEGKIDLYEKVRTKQRALSRMIDLVAGDVNERLPFDLDIVQADVPGEAAELRTVLERRFPTARITVSDFSPVISTHVGPGSIGLIFCQVK